MLKKKKIRSIKLIRKALDDAFSRFIRLRDSSGGGYGKCVTCGRINHIKEMDCGHFISRAKDDTRWAEQNCHLQCKVCNGFHGGKGWEMGSYIEIKYGKGTVDKLKLKLLNRRKFERFEIEAMTEHYNREARKHPDYCW